MSPTNTKNSDSHSAKTVRKPRTPKKVYDERHIFAGIALLAFVQITFVVLLLAGLDSLRLPDISSVAKYKPAEATRIYDRYGRLIDKMFVENRNVVPLSEMASLLPKAFVAAEDGRFYEHPGLDLISVFRAAINNARSGGRGQGGSTITQQVAKSLLLTPEKTYIRKIREAILAWRIDKLLTKDEILYIYLNQIYLGEGAHGVEAASQTYFGKSAKDINLAEISILAGLPQAPSKYSPMRHKKRAEARQKYVLNRMAADEYISSEDAQQAYGYKLKIRNKRNFSQPEYGYYLDVVKSEARAVLGGNLQHAGAKIYTNLDPGLQKKAAKAVLQGAVAIEIKQSARGQRVKHVPQGALVCIENGSGRVRALIGGRDYKESPFNRAVQAKRPVGSTIKPFVYAVALEKGRRPNSLVSDAPFSIKGKDGKLWSPKNYSGRFHGDVTMSTALTHSYNAATLRLLQETGYSRVHSSLKNAGITQSLQKDLSLALGAVDLTLLEMTGAYTNFAEQGVYTKPQFIRAITLANGNSLALAKPAKQRVFSRTVARNMEGMLNQVVKNGSGRKAAHIASIRGGKTGTSNSNRDAWFIGFTDQYTTGVWFGNDMNDPLGKKATGGSVAAPAWAKFMNF